MTQADLDRAITAARLRQTQGYFGKAKAGDQRAASLFVRLVALDLNSFGDPTGYGWLSKQPGEANVDGWAEDATVFGASPTDLMNVVDLINGAGAPGASIGGAIKARRLSNTWAAPKPLTAEEMAYISGPVVVPVPPAPTYPSYESLGGDEGGKKITRQLEADYRRAGKPGLDGDCGAWQQRVSYDFLTGKVAPVEAAIAKHRADWCAALGIAVTP